MSRPSDWHEVFGFGDPTPGDAWEVRRIGRQWDAVADEAEYAESTLRGLLGDDALVTWIGQAGDRFRERSSELPSQLGKVADSYRLASEAMTWWANRLEQHQSSADTQLSRGREARRDLEDALTRLHAAGADVRDAQSAASVQAFAPSPEQVRAATERVHAAEAAERAAQGLVDNAQARLDAARRLAADAGEARRSDGREAARRVRDAADAGVEPRSRWERFKDGASKVWDALVTVAKIVVAVLGVVVLIIGGPLAWVVLAAALVVLADALMKYANGEGSLWDVGLALLGCIPGTKGLTSLAALTAAFRSGGTLAAVSHVAMAGKDAAVALIRTADVLRRGFLPGVRATVQVLGQEGALAIPRLRSTLTEIGQAFVAADHQVSGMAAQARSWQGEVPYPGRDVYTNTVLQPGTRIEAGFPGLGVYAAPEGTAAAANHSASQVWEGLQVGPNLHDYRPSMIEIQVNRPVDAATGTTLANPQYGAGGTQQFYLDISEGLSRGDLSVLDHGGQPIDLVGLDPDEIRRFGGSLHQALGGQGTIPLHGADNPSPAVAYADEVLHNPDRFRAPDLAQIQIDIDLQRSVETISQVLRGTGYVGASR
jgi:hypothetical protein